MYTPSDPKRYYVVVESDEASIGKYSDIKMAREIFYLNLNRVKNIAVKGRNKIGVEFQELKFANDFLEDERLTNKGLITKIPYNYEATYSVLITFDGTSLPSEVKLYRLTYEVTPYIPPKTQCFGCFLYSHTKGNCNGKCR